MSYTIAMDVIVRHPNAINTRSLIDLFWLAPLATLGTVMEEEPSEGPPSAGTGGHHHHLVLVQRLLHFCFFSSSVAEPLGLQVSRGVA
jgi:hypothetical protein